MRIDISDGALLEGDREELESLIEDIEAALDRGEAVSVLLTDEGVEQFVIRVLPDAKP